MPAPGRKLLHIAMRKHQRGWASVLQNQMFMLMSCSIPGEGDQEKFHPQISNLVSRPRVQPHAAASGLGRGNTGSLCRPLTFKIWVSQHSNQPPTSNEQALSSAASSKQRQSTVHNSRNSGCKSSKQQSWWQWQQRQSNGSSIISKGMSLRAGEVWVGLERFWNSWKGSPVRGAGMILLQLQWH